MVSKLFGKSRFVLGLVLILSLALVVGCGSAAPEVVETEVIREVPREVEVEKQVIKEVPVEVEREVVREVPVEVTVEKEIIKEIPSERVVERVVIPTPIPAQVVEARVASERLDKVAVAVGGISWDSNYTYKVNIGGFLDKWPVYEYLVGVDNATGGYTGELATEWSIAENGKDWTFKLREDIPWQDGYGNFSAEDVRHSMWLLVQPTAAPSGASTWRKIMGTSRGDDEATTLARAEEVVEIIDDHEVVIHLGIVLPEALFNLGKRRNMPIESKARWDAVGDEGMGDKMVGTGPLQFVERVEGSHVLYDAVDEHWRVIPEYHQLEFRAIAESQTRLASLLTEQVHLAVIERAIRDEVTSRGFEFVSGVFPGIQHHWTFYGNYHTEPETLDPTNPMLIKEVRQAMAKAVNREAIVEALLPGAKVQIPSFVKFTELDGQNWPGLINPEWNERWDAMYGYDPDAARELLAAAGYADGFEFTLALDSNSALPEIIDIGQALALDFEAIGLKPTLANIEASKIRSQRRAREIHNTLAGSAGYSYTVYHLETLFCTCGSVHTFADPFIDQKIEELNVTVDASQRINIMREIGDFCYDNVCALHMFDVAPDIAINPTYIESYVFPGFISGFYTHLEYIETVPQ
ncbi:MAG: ABC transporter substrate-binding protein [Chloroflexota bacterium]|nr:ABC transporter substrate-binding protein [Chloroflexota bacterium]